MLVFKSNSFHTPADVLTCHPSRVLSLEKLVFGALETSITKARQKESFGAFLVDNMRMAWVTICLALLLVSSAFADDKDDDDRRRSRSSSKGDPLMEAFDGTPFWFHGIPGRYYNLISEQNVFQVATMLKEANNAVHIGSKTNGTYMQGVAFRQADGKVIVETAADDSARIKVLWGTEEVEMEDDAEVTREMTLSDGSKMSLVWSLYKQGSGTTVTVTTDAISISINDVPPSFDDNDDWQPSYLNMNVTLNRPPQGDLQGVIGDTYNFRSKDAAVNDDPLSQLPADSGVYPVFPDFTYEIANYFSSPRYTIAHHITHAVIAARRAAHLATAGQTEMKAERRRLSEGTPFGMFSSARSFA
eukprot:jgi/Botrbrau1/16203/Bobra.160_1s0004.1